MKKKILFVALSLILVISLCGCSLLGTTASTTQMTIDRSSIVADIYSEVYEKAKNDLYDDIYEALYDEFVDGTIDAETIQKQIYDVVNGNGKGNIGITNYTTNESGESIAHSTGSAIIYEKATLSDGTYRYYCLTNQHVVEDGKSFKVTFWDESSINAFVVGEDETTDIAVVYFDSENTYQVVPLGDSDDARVGEIVLAIGNPKGQTLYGTATFGIVSGLNRHIVENDSTNTILSYIQHDAAINPGNSGGGLYNLKGECIGINAIKYIDDVEGLGFAIPINLAKEVASEIREYGSYSGKVSFGITVAPVDALTSAGRVEYNVPSDITSGVVIISVDATSCSYNKLLVNDIIIGIATEESGTVTTITTSTDLSPFVANAKLGDTVYVTVLRGGVSTVVSITFARPTVAATTE